MKELDELTSKSVAAVMSEVEHGSDLRNDEAWAPAVIWRVLAENPSLLREAIVSAATRLDAGEDLGVDDIDLKMLDEFGRGIEDAQTEGETLSVASSAIVDTIYNRKGGVADALHDLGVAGDWSEAP